MSLELSKNQAVKIVEALMKERVETDNFPLAFTVYRSAFPVMSGPAIMKRLKQIKARMQSSSEQGSITYLYVMMLAILAVVVGSVYQYIGSF